MANSVRQRWTVQKTHRSSAQRSQTAKLPVICADTREIKKTRRRSKRHQPPHCNLPQTPMWKHIHPVCIPAKPPILDSPLPTKAQYAAMKRQRDQEYVHEMILAFMPPTNDVNEGILGTWRVWHRRFPQLTQDRFNAIVMVRRNGTEDWMEQNLMDRDDAFLRCEAQRIGRTGREAKHRADLQREEAKTAEDNRNTQAMHKKKPQEKETHAEEIELILDEAEIQQLAVVGLDEQLLKHRVLGKDPPFSAKQTQPRFEKPLSSMKKADKVKVVLELAQNHVNDNASA